MDVLAHNRKAWNKEANSGGRWSQPVGPEIIEQARQGNWELILTPNRPVPREWFPNLEGADVLALSSSGGQQAPILAAAGARVTSFDLSDEQLARDQLVAERDGLEIRTVQGDMADLSVLEDESFDLIFHACSNGFSETILPVWRECHRVLRPGGVLLAGFLNPASFLIDQEKGGLQIVNRLPYKDITHLKPEELELRRRHCESLEFSHSLEEQIGGQLQAGLILTGLYEDDWEDKAHPMNSYMPLFIATRSVKLKLESPT